jgi:ribonucleoside-diphosphate reductase alpha chain
MSPIGASVYEHKYKGNDPDWEGTAYRLAVSVVGPVLPEYVDKVAQAITNFEFMPGGRQIANAGRSNFLNNCFLYRVEDSKEGIAEFFRKVTVTWMTGGGTGAVWSDLRPEGALVKSNGGVSTGPLSFMYSQNEIGRGIVNGGSRRVANWAGLHWWHPDVLKFIAMKDWTEEQKAAKAKDPSAYAPMDMTNISVILDDEFFEAYNDPNFSMVKSWGDDHYTINHAWARKVYVTAVEKMLTTGEPGFSVDIGENAGENLRNPCCEITSYDDSDVCCLGSVNMAQIDNLDRFEEVVELGTVFLLCSTIISNVPHDEVLATREKNRRLGLGLMGVYEWLVKRGYRYEENPELAEWLEVWKDVSDHVSATTADRLGVSRPVKNRALAPTGTLGMIAGKGTTTSGEPLFAPAYKRTWLKNGVWQTEYVIDGTADRLINEHGLDPDSLETAYDLAFDPGRRLAFQAFIQRYTDHAISSTLNLPRPEFHAFTPEQFGEILMEHLPNLRGVTAYPDGARGGQPLNVVPYAEAMDKVGIVFEEFGLDQACVNGVCGI